LGSLLPASAAGPVFCGSLVAMSAPIRLPTYHALFGASLMAGVCQQSITGLLVGGWGGKLSTGALLGVVSYQGLAKALASVSKK
jgi:hypothetical protein